MEDKNIYVLLISCLFSHLATLRRKAGCGQCTSTKSCHSCVALCCYNAIYIRQEHLPVVDKHLESIQYEGQDIFLWIPTCYINDQVIPFLAGLALLGIVKLSYCNADDQLTAVGQHVSEGNKLVSIVYKLKWEMVTNC